MKTFSGKFVIAISLIMLINISISMAQTSTIKHIVDKGETLESIAKKYGTTQEKIIEMNPEAGQFVYVGMELFIPNTSNNIKQENQTSYITNEDDLDTDNEQTSSTDSFNSKSQPTVSPSLENTPNRPYDEVRVSYIADDGLWGLSLNFLSKYIGLGWEMYFYDKMNIYNTNNFMGFHIDLTYPFYFENKNLFYIRPTIGLGWGWQEKTAKHNSDSPSSKSNGILLNFHPEAGLRILPNVWGGGIYLTAGWLYQSMKKIVFKPKYGSFTIGLAYIRD